MKRLLLLGAILALIALFERLWVTFLAVAVIEVLYWIWGLSVVLLFMGTVGRCAAWWDDRRRNKWHQEIASKMHERQ